jgi:hypothetical protein
MDFQLLALTCDPRASPSAQKKQISIGIMKPILTKTLVLGLTVVALIAGCSTKEEKAAKQAAAELKQARLDAEKAFKDANYPTPETIESKDLRSAEEIISAASREDGLQVLNLGAMPAPDGSNASPDGETRLPAPEGQLPAGEEGPQYYEKICTPYLSSSQRLFDARCAGRQVTGVGRVVYSYPQTGTRIVVGRTNYVINFKAPAPPHLFYNDIVTLHGVVGSKTRYGTYAELDDVTVEIMKPEGTPAQLRAMKLLQLGEICLDLMKQTSEDDVARGLKYLSFVKKGALHPALPNSGAVEIENNISGNAERCVIENNKIRVAQVGSKDYVDGKEVMVWEDRAAAHAKDEMRSKQADAEREAEKKKKVDEYKSLSAKEKVGRLTVALESSAEALAEAIPGDFSAQGYLELCNVALADGLRSFKEQGIVGRFEDAARTCSGYASTICNPGRRTRGCEAYHDKAFPIVNVMLDAR